MKTYHITTIGCQMNKADSERFAKALEDLGYEEAPKRIEADLVVVNTCGVRQSAENRVYGLIPRIKKDNKGVLVILTGCLVMREDVKKRLKKYVDVWLPIVDLSKLSSKLNGLESKPNKEYLSLRAKYNSKFSAFLPIGNGCDNFCSYCVVPYARGREKYRSANAIIREAKDLIKNGYKEITLIAQNVNSYKCKKTGINFSNLLKKVNDLEGDFWLRFATSHPKDMSDELIKTMGECNKLCEHLHLPAQAGNNFVLKKMNRGYTREHYKKLIRKIKKIMPDVSLTTDIIVGFPSETRGQFNDTVKLFHEIGFDVAFISQFSPRPGTSAYKMVDNVTLCEKKRRETELMKILKRTSTKNNKKYIGGTYKVLIDSRSKNGELCGRTRSGKVVKIANSQTENELIGEFVNVKINSVVGSKMVGERVLEKIVVIVGTTASGKTNLAVDLAYKFDGEVVSADSRQVYIGMDIGSGKDLCEYELKKGRKKIKIPYHLIDVISPKKEFSLADFKKKADEQIKDILKRGKLPIIAGGTGLYAQAVVDGFKLSKAKPDKVLRKKLEAMSVDSLFKELKIKNKKLALSLNDSERKNKRRLVRHIEISKQGNFEAGIEPNSNYKFLIIGLTWPKEVLHKNIYKRIIDRLENEDMVGEVSRLHKEGVSWGRLERFGLEYKFISLYLREKLSREEMIEQLFIATRQFAKKQLNWLKRWEEQGAKIHWVKKKKLSEFNKAKKEVGKLVNRFVN